MNQISLISYKHLLIITFVLLQACNHNNRKAAISNISAKTVEVRYENGKYQLYRHGRPYFINGAGGYHYFNTLKANGGNSIRVWDTNQAKQVLDEAHRLGLTVTLGLYVAPGRKGFDYTNDEAVEKQFNEIKKIVETYKDHPALLMWAIGNELNYLSFRSGITDVKSIISNIKLWREVNNIAKMIHQVDPNHPTTTVLAGASPLIQYLPYLCPEIDILSINIFGSLPDLRYKLRYFGWDGPYVVTEWGPSGYWEAPRTSWDVAIEETSTQKAKKYKERYDASINQDKAHCLGSYVFMWDVKQERTHTWFSMFIDSGEETAMIDALHYLWKGRWPENRSPVVEPVYINGKQGIDNVMLVSDSVYSASVVAYDHADTLRFTWEILPELTGFELKEGGDVEKKPAAIQALLISEENKPKISFKAPSKAGAYRLYVYVFDQHHHVATANIPFYVML